MASYRDSLRLLLLFASHLAGRPPSRLSVEDLDRDVILAFLDHLENERSNTIRTRNARLTAIRSFFQYVAYRDPTVMGIARGVLTIQGKRATKCVVSYLRKDEFDAILKALDRDTMLGRRDHTLLQFLAHTGARVSEAIGVNASDLQLWRPWHVLLRGKGSKERVVPITKDMAALLKALCRERGLDPSSEAAVFVNARGHRLTRRGVTHIVHRAVKTAAKTKPHLAKRPISPHTLRHYVPFLTMSRTS